MKLPNAHRAFVDIAKLRDYSLSSRHADGKHKARVFAAALALAIEDAEWLRDQLLRAARDHNCQPGRSSVYGQRYVLDFVASRRDRSVKVRSVWLVRQGEDFPRLITCYVL